MTAHEGIRLLLAAVDDLRSLGDVRWRLLVTPSFIWSVSEDDGDGVRLVDLESPHRSSPTLRMVGEPLVSLVEGGAVVCSSYVDVGVVDDWRAPSGYALSGAGRYDDRLVEDEGVWRLASRLEYPLAALRGPT